MNLQKVFDTAVKGILAQGRLAKKTGGVTCYYRHPKDPAIRCAIGHNIPDSKYEPQMEGRSPTLSDSVTRKIVTCCGGKTEWDAQQLRLLQSAHDYARSIKDFRDRARKFAEEFNLNTGVLDNA